MVAVSRPATRDLRIDFFRGIVLIEIFVNHMPGNTFETLSHKNFGITDAAEVFVFLAGISASYAYFPTFANGRPGLAIARVLHRVGTLYVAHLANILLGLALFSAAALWFGAQGLLANFNIPAVFEAPREAFVGMGLLVHQIGYFNILPIYVALLALLPVVMALARVDARLLLAVSVGVWAIAQTFMINIPNYPSEGAWFFNPFAWQLLFVLGFLLGHRVMTGKGGIPYHPVVFWAAIVYLVICGSYAWFNMWGTIPDFGVSSRLVGNDKTYVALPRLAHILALAYVVGHSRIVARLTARLTPVNLFVVMGRHSLPVFWAGALLSVCGLVIRYRYTGWSGEKPMPEMPGVFWLDAVLVLAGTAVQMLLALFLDWKGRATAAARRPAIPVSPAPPSRPIAPAQ
jgi:Uncharacterized protein conserved in bacteria